MSEKRNVPKLRFPEYLTGTSPIKKHFFQDLFLFSTGKNIKQSEASPEFEIPCVRYGELYHMYKEVITKVINRTNLDKSELLFSSGDEILLPSAGEDPLDIGSASALTVKNVAIGRTINILRPKHESDYSPIFVSYYINQRLKVKISSLAKGVSISNVYNSDLKTLEILLPSLPEQKKIAEFLTAVDQRIELLQAKKEKLEAYKKGVMQKIFSQQLRFKADDGSEFPDWEERKLGEVCIKKSSNVTAGSLSENSGEFKIYGATGFLQYVDFFQVETPFISIVKDGAGVGRVLKCDPRSSVLGTLDMIIPKPEVDVDFLYAMLGNINFLNYITGSTIPHIYFKDYAKETISLPTLLEQKKIVQFLTSLDRSIENLNQQINHTQTWKKGLLQKMFV